MNKNDIFNFQNNSTISADNLTRLFHNFLICDIIHIEDDIFNEKLLSNNIVTNNGIKFTCYLPKGDLDLSTAHKVSKIFQSTLSKYKKGSNISQTLTIRQLRLKKLAIFLGELLTEINCYLTSDEIQQIEIINCFLSTFLENGEQIELCEKDRQDCVEFILGNNVKYITLSSRRDELLKYKINKTKSLLGLLSLRGFKGKLIELNFKYRASVYSTLSSPIEELIFVLHELGNQITLNEIFIKDKIQRFFLEFRGKSKKLHDLILAKINKSPDKIMAVKSVMKVIKSNFTYNKSTHGVSTKALENNIAQCVMFMKLLEYLEEIPELQCIGFSFELSKFGHAANFLYVENKLYYADIGYNRSLIELNPEDFEKSNISYNDIVAYFSGNSIGQRSFLLPQKLIPLYKNDAKGMKKIQATIYNRYTAGINTLARNLKIHIMETNSEGKSSLIDLLNKISFIGF